MKAEDLILNIAVNLERLAGWAVSGNTKRVEQFLKQTELYLADLKSISVDKKFKPTLLRFEKEMKLLRESEKNTSQWAERALTWANILTHRAKLA